MESNEVTPVGVFHAHATRDAAALERDGHPIYRIKELDRTDRGGPRVFEVLFADGLWMLAGAEDLTLQDVASGHDGHIELGAQILPFRRRPGRW